MGERVFGSFFGNFFGHFLLSVLFGIFSLSLSLPMFDNCVLLFLFSFNLLQHHSFSLFLSLSLSLSLSLPFHLSHFFLFVFPENLPSLPFTYIFFKQFFVHFPTRDSSEIQVEEEKSNKIEEQRSSCVFIKRSRNEGGVALRGKDKYKKPKENWKGVF